MSPLQKTVLCIARHKVPFCRLSPLFSFPAHSTKRAPPHTAKGLGSADYLARLRRQQTIEAAAASATSISAGMEASAAPVLGDTSSPHLSPGCAVGAGVAAGPSE